MWSWASWYVNISSFPITKSWKNRSKDSYKSTKKNCNISELHFKVLQYIYIYICVIIYVCIYIYNISIAKSTKFNLQSKHLQISSFSHDRSRVRRRPESVERHLERSHCPALRPCDRQWCEPSMGQSSRGPASPWLFFGPIPSKRSYTYGLYIYIYISKISKISKA